MYANEQIKKHKADSLFARALIFQGLMQYEMAEQCLKRIGNWRNYPVLCMALGKIYIKRGLFKNATNCFSYIPDLQTNIDALVHYVRCLRLTGELSEATSFLDGALKQNSYDEELYLWAAIIYIENSDFMKAFLLLKVIGQNKEEEDSTVSLHIDTCLMRLPISVEEANIFDRPDILNEALIAYGLPELALNRQILPPQQLHLSDYQWQPWFQLLFNKSILPTYWNSAAFDPTAFTKFGNPLNSDPTLLARFGNPLDFGEGLLPKPSYPIGFYPPSQAERPTRYPWEFAQPRASGFAAYPVEARQLHLARSNYHGRQGHSVKFFARKSLPQKPFPLAESQDLGPVRNPASGSAATMGVFGSRTDSYHAQLVRELYGQDHVSGSTLS